MAPQDRSPTSGDSADRPKRADERPILSPQDKDGTQRLSVPEMDCASCATKVENSVSRLDGVEAIEPQATTGTLLVTYDTEQTTLDAIIDRVEKAGYNVEERRNERTRTFAVPDMDCASCAGTVENSLERLDVVSFETNPTTGNVVVTYDPETASEADITHAIEYAGYDVAGSSAASSGEQTAPNDGKESVWTSSRGIKTWISGGFVAMGSCSSSSYHLRTRYWPQATVETCF